MTEALDEQVYAVSGEVFELAKAAAAEAFTDAQVAAALELAAKINELMPLAEEQAGGDETLVRELTEARLELGYVYNRGRGATSTRMFQHLRSDQNG